MKASKFILVALLSVTTAANAQKYVGGDVSNLTANEAMNPAYMDFDGKECAALDLYKHQGLNAMRVRLHVNPSDFPNNDPNVCQDIEYVKALGKRIKDAGFKLMLDFHYSDTWADPGKQWTPKEWEKLSDAELYTQIYEYTKDMLRQMKEAGAEPELIQTGNEISYGMLWGPADTPSPKKCFLGNDANWTRFTTLLKQAVKACREVCPNARIILHTERVTQPDVLTNFYNRMKADDVDYDIIGLSYYPIWHNNIKTLETALNTLETQYKDKEIMIVETGAAYSWLPEAKEFTPSYAASEKGQKQFTDELITMLNRHDSVTGLFWWWIDYNPYPWQTTHMDNWWYAPLYDGNTGYPLSALSSLKNFLEGETAIRAIKSDTFVRNDMWTPLSGIRIKKPTHKGVYIHNNRKVVVK